MDIWQWIESGKNDMDRNIGIYIHIPFCKSKCYYCDFNSYPGMEYLAGSYFNALRMEMGAKASLLTGRPVKSIFIGGGTPSLVNPAYIAGLLDDCSKNFVIENDAEISMESNPGTLTLEALKEYRAAGINRISIGLQAWQNRLLSKMGRIHTREQFVENIEAASKAGFQNINVDLIFGLPGQSFEDWKETLEAVTVIGEGAGLTHLSCYSLIVEEGTVYGSMLEKGTLEPVDDELDRKMYRYAISYLAGKGYRHYEISNFAKPGYECRHNLQYWKALEYAGFGAGAHSYLNGKRFNNVYGIEEYIEAVKAFAINGTENKLHQEISAIDRREAMSEYMILGLRLISGVTSEEFETRFGEKLNMVYGEQLEKLLKEGLLEASGNKENTSVPCERYYLTDLGLDFANKVFREFL